jgi:two-component system CheB/CheR fusion protein
MAFLQAELIRVVQRLSFCGDMEGVMTVLSESARRLSGADGVTVVLREGDLCHYVEESSIAPLWKGRRFPLEACISGWCMLRRQQVAIEDIYADPRVPHEAYRPTFVKSLAMTPIRSEEPIGALGAYWADHHRATAEELEILQWLGNSAAMAFANCRLIEQLKEANQRKDAFLSMLAHELRGPLAPVRNALRVLELRAPEGEDEVAGRARDLLQRQIQILARIVDDLLDVARLNRGQIALRRERLDLARLVRQAAEDYRGMLEEVGIRLSLELPETPVWVLGDSARLAQALGNLLENAGKFTPTGGEVTVLMPPGPQATVTVRDDGIGIEPEVLPRIFEVFGQASQSLARDRGGLGLGLSVARALLELHGGTIEAASDGLGKGAEFTLRLPREEELPALAEDVVPSPPEKKPLRILVVEDNLDSAESLRMFLELLGTGSRWPTRGRTAWRLLRPCGRMSCSATSASPGWTASRWPARCAAIPRPPPPA